MKAPAFQFYADDFIGGTLTMTHEERGLYILALCLQWGQGSIGDGDLERLGSGMAQPSLSQVRAKFQLCEDGRLRNAKMESVRKKQEDYRAERSIAGRKGANAKWKHGSANGSAIAKPMANDGSPSPSPSPSLNSDSKIPPNPQGGSGGEFALAGEDSGKGKRQRFMPPTIEEWIAEAETIKFSEAGARAAYFYYESNGWKVGKNPMKVWKAAVRTCAEREGITPFNRANGYHKPAPASKLSREPM